MAKSCKRKCKRHNKTMRHRKRNMQRGGELAGNPPSAWGYGLGTMGDGWTQFMNYLFNLIKMEILIKVIILYLLEQFKITKI